MYCCSGRKKAALLYVLTYTSGCVTKHFNDFNVLFVGRIFSGVATSLLYSAFESWLVAEHKKVKLPSHSNYTRRPIPGWRLLRLWCVLCKPCSDGRHMLAEAEA